MSITCDTGVAGCKITCPGTSCLAIYWPETKECTTSCCDEKISVIGAKIKKKANIQTKIDISIGNAEVAKIALVLDTILDRRILVPATKVYTRITERWVDKPLEEVVHLLGLKLA